MIGLLRPVGPETAGTYWVRRAIVLATTIILVIALLLIINGTSSGSTARAGASLPSATPSAVTPPLAITTPMALPASAVSDLSSLTAATKTPSPKPAKKKVSEPKPVGCPAKELRTTLTGKIRLVTKQRATFQLAVINGSDQTCLARVTKMNFELKISSASERIWSSRDCPATLTAVSRKLAPNRAVAWSLSWNGKRSTSECKSARQAPSPGRYVATAKLDGTDPVKLRMILSSR